MYKIIPFTLFFLICFHISFSQKTIELKNPSFEDMPHAGSRNTLISEWKNCGELYFQDESPPDIHLSYDLHESTTDHFFGVKKYASDGNTFLGMVVREDDTFEAVSQKLRKKLEAGKCYSFSIDLSRSLDYTSPYSPIMEVSNTKKFITPTVLSIFGSSKSCDHEELLAQSIPIANRKWETYNFVFRPTNSYKHIMLEAFYDESLGVAYNGNLLLDNASEIMKIECPDEE